MDYSIIFVVPALGGILALGGGAYLFWTIKREPLAVKLPQRPKNSKAPLLPLLAEETQQLNSKSGQMQPKRIPGGIIYLCALNWLAIFANFLLIFFGWFFVVPQAAVLRAFPSQSLFVLILIWSVTITYFLLKINEGLLVCKPWARIWQIMVSALGLLIIPIGTILYGIALYYALFNKEVALRFDFAERESLKWGGYFNLNL